MGMTKRLHDEIKQQKPWANAESEAFLNVQRTADVLMRGLEKVLKPFGLTQTQYNVLRILRGAGPEGMACSELGARMVTRDPDVTRLLDRLEANGMVARKRLQSDRRSVRIHISREGLSQLKKLDVPVAGLHKRQLEHLGEKKVRQFVKLLEAARAHPE